MKSHIFAAAAVGFALALLLSDRPTAAFSPPALSPPRSRSTTRGSPTALNGVRSAVRRVFRRGVRTLEKEDASKTAADDDDDEPKEMFRLVYHDSCDYQPEGVARVLAKLLPMLDRRTAYELCSHARMAGSVPLLVTDRNDAERYSLLLRQYGLAATVEPHGSVPKK